MDENEKVNEQNEQQVNNDGELKKQAAETLKETKEKMKKKNFKEKEKKGKVIDVVQKGYQLKDKVIRFSKVVVGE